MSSFTQHCCASMSMHGINALVATFCFAPLVFVLFLPLLFFFLAVVVVVHIPISCFALLLTHTQDMGSVASHVVHLTWHHLSISHNQMMCRPVLEPSCPPSFPPQITHTHTTLLHRFSCPPCTLLFHPFLLPAVHSCDTTQQSGSAMLFLPFCSL